jgi:hypothetical protein
MFVIVALFAVYLIWVLLPLLPAIIIYRLFPESFTELVGKVAGYTIKAGGAFAAYLAVVVMTYTQIDKINEAIYSYKHQFWTAIGQVQLVDAQGKMIKADNLIDHLIVVTRPEPNSVDKYQLRLKLMEDPNLPLVVLKIPKFGEQQINWKPLARDHVNGIITLDKIVIQEDPSFSNQIATPTARLESEALDSSAK